MTDHPDTLLDAVSPCATLAGSGSLLDRPGRLFDKQGTIHEI
jgi:hypothetical protein